MSGLRFIAVYVGIVWFLASAGALWGGISVYSQTSKQKQDIREAIAKQAAELEEEKEALGDEEHKLNKAIQAAKDEITVANTDLEEAGEDKKAVKDAEKKKEKADKALEKAEAAKAKAVEKIGKALEDLVAEEKKQLAAVDEMPTLTGMGGAPSVWKAIIALVLGIALILLGVILRTLGGMSRAKRADPLLDDPEFTKELDDTPATAPAPIDDDEDTPLPGKP